MIDDVAVLREILRRELETINSYEEMAQTIKDPHLREIVAHITDEEREHVAEMYQLIIERDGRQRACMERSQEHLQTLAAPPAARPTLSVGAVSGAAALPTPPPGPPGPVDLNPPPAPIFESSAWSVGSLKRVR